MEEKFVTSQKLSQIADSERMPSILMWSRSELFFKISMILDLLLVDGKDTIFFIPYKESEWEQREFEKDDMRMTEPW